MNVTRQSDNDLKTYSLIWLDASVNSEGNIHIQQKLRLLTNYLQVFNELDQCEKYIQSVSSQDRIVLIINDDLSSRLIPRIHQLHQVYSIYIYCQDKEFNQSGIQQYTKVKGTHNDLDKLIEQIRCDKMKSMRNTIDEPLSMSIYNTNIEQEQTTSGLDGRFVHSQLLTDCLLRMQPTPTDKNEFISFCQQEYIGNEKELEIIREFEKSYSSDRSIWWYTREAFLYRLINKGLRIQNIDLLFGLRFIIRDIEQQLLKHQSLIPIQVYRGQLISTKEFQILKESKGKLISMNSFLSTSLNRRTALIYLDTSKNNPNVQQVLFEINADPCRDGVKPFANVSSLSLYPEEEEVLMMLGSVFRINNIHLDDNKIWIIEMTLCSDNDHDLKSVFNHMKNQYGTKQTRLLLFGHVLVDMAYFDEAEKYYHRLLIELPSDHRDIPRCYHAHGKVACEKGIYDSSLQWLYKTLEILQGELKINHSQIAFIYTSIGEVYQKKKDNKQALQSYTKALQIWKEIFGNDHECIAWCFNNIAMIYDIQKKYSKALDYHKKALNIKKKTLPAHHPCLGNTYINIGNVYYHLTQYDKALENYRLSYETYQNSLTPQHPSIASVLRNIGIVYEVKRNFSEALENYRRAALIRQKTFSSVHPDVVKIEQDIKRVLLKIK